MKPSGDMKMKNRHLLARSFVIFLGITVLISCSGGAGDSRDGGVVSIPEAGPAKAASCSDFPSFRYFYSRQKREGLSGWEIAYLLSLGHAPDDLAGMSFDFSDSFHKMNPFDASLVEISDISGSVRY